MITPTIDTLLAAMRHPASYPHPVVHTIQVIHTHISTVFLTGEFAYKIKKPVNFGFLDFTQLADRKHFCETELHLNRRLAPALYLGVVPIFYHDGSYRLGENLHTAPLEGEQAVEYAVKMRQFDPQQQLDHLLDTGSLPISKMDALAQTLAAFHQAIEQAAPDSEFGLPARVLQPMLQNFLILRANLDGTSIHQRLGQLENWTRQQSAHLHDRLQQRKDQGHIRACHGDMHLGNIALINGEITIFDGIEFNDDLRWIDTASDCAFLLMDLVQRKASRHAWRLLNNYFEKTGDYGLLAVLAFYTVYRAMVRAKVNALRYAQQTDSAAKTATLDECLAYLTLAEQYANPTPPALLITHGLSGSGKSWGCRELAETLGFIHIRSDVERKRLADMQATERHTTGLDQGIYSTSMTGRTYTHLLELAETCLCSQHRVIVDATFLDRQQRQRFQQLAAQHNTTFLILHFEGTPEQLETNIRQRLQANNDASDADLAVLHKQLAYYKPLQDDEPCVTVQSNGCLPITVIQAHLNRTGETNAD